MIKNDFKDKLEKVYKFIGFKINSNLALVSITGSTYGELNDMQNQDTLAIIGDHVLKLVISTHLFNENNKINKNSLTHELHCIESNENLQSLGKKYNIEDFLLLHSKEENNDKKLATSIEAIIGAIYINSGYKKCIKFINKLGLI